VKIATSSATFAREIAAGDLTQLDWLDACANELEVDGVVFDVAHFPRLDGEYVAQLKKVACDLGLSIAAVDARATPDEPAFALAVDLGAPLVVARAPASSDDARAWGAFADQTKAATSHAKRLNVTLAIRNVPGTLCPDVADLRRLAKDVDSAWLRFALDAGSPFEASDDRSLAKTSIAFVPMPDLGAFAEANDAVARDAIERLARFRGFVVLEGAATTAQSHAYHAAVRRFTTIRTNALESSAFV